MMSEVVSIVGEAFDSAARKREAEREFLRARYELYMALIASLQVREIEDVIL